jgi:hypothetical protein
MSPFTIIVGVIGVVLVLIGLVGVRAGKRPANSWAGIGVGFVLIGVTIFLAVSGGSEPATESAGVTINVSSTATAAAAVDSESTSAAEEADLPVIMPENVPDNLSELKVIHEFTTGVANFDGFKLVEVRAYGPQDAQVDGEEMITLKLNQEVYIEFQVKNLRKGPVILEKAFVGAIDARGETREVGAEHEGVEVARYQDYRVGVTVLLDQPGQWVLWPCYKLNDPDETLRNECTEKWQFFEVEVVE